MDQRTKARVGGALLILLAGIALGASQEEERRVFVAVADGKGQPLAERSADAFRVWENGTARTVVSAGPAADPAAVVIIVHGSTPSDTQSIRRALQATIEVFRAANPETTVGLATSVITPRLESVTAGAKALEAGIGRFATSGPGLILFEAVEEAVRVLSKQERERRIVLVITNASKNDADAKPATAIGAAIKRANASLWALDYTSDFAKPNETIRNSEERARLLTDWTAASGGTYNRVIGSVPLPQAGRQLARLIASQYVVTYRRPAGTGQVELRAGVRGDAGERVLGPSWSAR